MCLLGLKLLVNIQPASSGSCYYQVQMTICSVAFPGVQLLLIGLCEQERPWARPLSGEVHVRSCVLLCPWQWKRNAGCNFNMCVSMLCAVAVCAPCRESY